MARGTPFYLSLNISIEALATAFSCVSAVDSRLPLMSVSALPPNFLVAITRNVTRHQIIIPRWMPLPCERWVNTCKVISKPNPLV